MEKIDLRKIINELERKTHIRLIPKYITTTIWDKKIKEDIEHLIDKFNLREGYKGYGWNAHLELARENGVDPTKSNEYDVYYASFENEIFATRFMYRVNKDQESEYTATPCQDGDITLLNLTNISRLK